MNRTPLGSRSKPANASQLKKELAFLATRLCLTSILIASLASTAATQSAPSRKDIPTIAKDAKEAIVTIVMANDDKPIALGTGFLATPDGAIVTNYHVIATGNVAVAKFADGTISPVDGVLAADKVSDLAVIKIHGKTFRTLTLGNSDQIQVGEEVVAIGNPLGLELSVSNGILSGIRSDEKKGGKLLQITAPISHGSSGGPLFNMYGEVVGVNTLYLEGGESLNFAIPVNDVKNLLNNQSAQLKQLPNESEGDAAEPNTAKPDASTGLPPDAASPREKQHYSFICETKDPRCQAHSYYVRSRQRNSYIIEHDGKQMLATCREALSWRDGTDNPGRPMVEHDCFFMHVLVGKQIPSELIWQGDKELRYQPFVGQNKVQVADILDVTAEAPIGALLRRPSPKTSPEILKTLHWIQNTLADEDGDTIFAHDDKRRNQLQALDGCQVAFVKYTEGLHFKVIEHTREYVNLGDLDPASVAVRDGIEDKDIADEPVSDLTVQTTDKLPAVRLMFTDWSWEPSETAPAAELRWQLPAPYATRFAKALRHAITLCGGKPSSF